MMTAAVLLPAIVLLIVALFSRVIVKSLSAPKSGRAPDADSRWWNEE